jgi:hypothetical protein
LKDRQSGNATFLMILTATPLILLTVITILQDAAAEIELKRILIN